jgi:Ni,Fe-hydrogenase I large subunit
MMMIIAGCKTLLQTQSVFQFDYTAGIYFSRLRQGLQSQDQQHQWFAQIENNNNKKKKLGALEAREESESGKGGIASGADLTELSHIMEPDVTCVQNYSYLEVLESGWVYALKQNCESVKLCNR